MAEDVAANLSVVANAFAVVGLAEIVFKAGTQVYDLYDRCCKATATRNQVLTELKASTAIIQQVWIFLTQLENSAAQDPSFLAHIRANLSLCDNEFKILQAAVRDTQHAASDHWMKRVTKMMGWAMQESMVSQSCQRIHRLCGYLSTALAVSNGWEACQFRKEIRENVLALTQKVDAQTTALAVRDRRVDHSLRPTTLAQTSRKPRKVATLNSKPAAHRRDREESRDRRSASQPDLTMDSIGANLEIDRALLLELDSGMSTAVASSAVLERITMPTMILKSALTSAAQTLSSSQLGIASSIQTQVAQHIDYLLLLCHVSSAESLVKGTSPPSCAYADALDAPWVPPTPSPGSVDALRPTSWSRRGKRLLHKAKEYVVELPYGVITCRIDFTRDVFHIEPEDQLFAFNLVFEPRASFVSGRLSISYLSSDSLALLSSLDAAERVIHVDGLLTVLRFLRDVIAGMWDYRLEGPARYMRDFHPDYFYFSLAAGLRALLDLISKVALLPLSNRLEALVGSAMAHHEVALPSWLAHVVVKGNQWHDTKEI